MKKVKLYARPKDVAALSTADQNWWLTDGAIALLVILLSSLDAVTLFSVFDAVCYNSQAIGIVLTIGCAITLNFLPLVEGRLYQCYRYKLNGVKRWMLIALALVFVILFAATFGLRWTTRALTFTGAESTMSDATGQSAAVSSTDEDSDEAVAMTVLLGIMPCVTSIINLALGYLTDDPVKRKLRKLTVVKAKLEQRLALLKGAEHELDRDWEAILRSNDDADLMAVLTLNDAVTEHKKGLARYLLAQKLKEPDDISLCLEEPIDVNREVFA
ncbi:MAG TPA: hypothetical protein VN446_06390 [Candidatus Acidoferrum sp.]|nr:hypothetical protein [Candidatus Acidoferrum sp.]